MREDSSLVREGFTLGSEPALRSMKTRSCQGKRKTELCSLKGTATLSSLFLLIFP